MEHRKFKRATSAPLRDDMVIPFERTESMEMLPGAAERPLRRVTVTGISRHDALAADLVSGVTAPAWNISVPGSDNSVRSSLAPRRSRQVSAAGDIDVAPPSSVPLRRVTLSGAEGSMQLQGAEGAMRSSGLHSQPVQRVDLAGVRALALHRTSLALPAGNSRDAVLEAAADAEQLRRRVTVSGWESAAAAGGSSFMSAARWSMRRLNLTAAVAPPPESGLSVTQLDTEPTEAGPSSRGVDDSSSNRRLPTPRVMLMLRQRTGAIVPEPAPTAPELP